MKKTVFSLAIALIYAFTCWAQSNLTPDKILNDAASKIGSQKALEADFSFSASGTTGRGQIKASGGKFFVKLPSSEVWFNGKALYTYNVNTNETTIVSPTPEEILQSNPLAYITGAPKNYNATFSTVKKADRYVLELTPKSKGQDINRITLTLKKKDLLPEKIVVEPKSGSPVSSEIVSIKFLNSLPQSVFEYQKARHPKADIIDLR